MKQTSRQNGSAHVIIIAVLVVALIGALGWIFWQNVNKYYATGQKKSPASSESTSTVKSKYLIIKEWGVKIPYEGVDTLTYTYNVGTASIGSAVSVKSQYLTAKYSGSSSCSMDNAGDLDRGKANDLVPTNDILTVDGASLVDDPPALTFAAAYENTALKTRLGKVGLYYYIYGTVISDNMCDESDLSKVAKPNMSGITSITQ